MRAVVSTERMSTSLAALSLIAGAAIVALPLALASGANPRTQGATDKNVGSTPQPCDKFAPPLLSETALRRVMQEHVRIKVKLRLQTKPGRHTLDVKGLAFVAAPPSVVVQVLGDYEAYQKFMPRVMESARSVLPSGEVIVRMKVDALFPLADFLIETSNSLTRCGLDHWLVRWRRHGGSLPENRGATVVYPAPGWGSIIRQKAVVSIDSRLPGDYVGRGLRRYYHFLLQAVIDQSSRALAHGWYAGRGVRPASIPY